MMQDTLVQGMREEEKNGRKIEELNESYTERLGVIWRRTAKRGLQRMPSGQTHNELDLQ